MHPTSILPDKFIKTLESLAVKKRTFKELTDVENPWDIDRESMERIRERMHGLESELRFQQAHPTVCITASEGAYWVSENELPALQEKIQQTIQTVTEKGPMPVWKYTTAEMLIDHVRNIKRMILAVVHDSVLLENLKFHLGDNYTAILREFRFAERSILDVLDTIREQGDKIPHALNEDMILLERCRITQTMLEFGETTEEILGFTEERLNQAIAKLNERCHEITPSARIILRSLNNFSKEALRGSESSQLVRASRWEMLLSLMEEPPKESKAFQQIIRLEREGFSHFVSSREAELGTSEQGQSALTQAKEAQKTTEDKNNLPPSILDDAAGTQIEPAKPVRRMVTRLRRAYA